MNQAVMDHTAPARMVTPLWAMLTSRGLDPASIVATYNDLHPSDICDDFRSMSDVIAANVHHLLDRMHDGPRITHGTKVLSFAAVGHGRARLTGFRCFLMRRPGVVPGDIVYDYEAAHLLHAFIARASAPVFYDTCDEEGADDLIGTLSIRWPEECGDTILQASDPRIALAN